MAPNPDFRLSVDAFFDLVCPWCLIGKRHLATAIAQLRSERPDVAVDVEWRSSPLIPGTPLPGVPYRAFYVARLGSPQAVAARQAQVQAAACDAGLTLALTRIETFPNTLLAHRLVGFVREDAGAAAAADLVDDLFTRYFIQAQDIGDTEVLGQALRECGVQVPGPVLHDAAWLPPLPACPARNDMGVPHFVFDRAHSVSGAQPPAVLLDAMRSALARMAG